MLTPLNPELIVEPDDARSEEALIEASSRFREDEKREAERFLGFEDCAPSTVD